MSVCRYVVFTSVENVFRFIYASLNHDHGKVFHIHLTRLGWVQTESIIDGGGGDEDADKVDGKDDAKLRYKMNVS